MIVGHIGARKGSKGVPGKNFLMLEGKPLIAWSLEQLVRCPQVDLFVVSTDDERIFDFALQAGASDIGMRPAELSGDSVSKWNV